MKKTVFVQTVCVFCLLFVFLSCEKDYLEKQSDKKTISKEDIFDGNLEFYGFNQTNGDSIGVYTIGDYGWYIHNGGRYTYTFRVTNTPEGGYLQNILFDCDENDTCYVYLFEYDLTQSERDSIMAGNKVNLEGKIVNVESLSPDEVDVAARSGPCAPIFTYVDISYCHWGNGNHPGGHEPDGDRCPGYSEKTYVYVNMHPCQGASPPLIFNMGGGGGGGSGTASSTATSNNGNYPCIAFSSESPCNNSFTTPVSILNPPGEDEYIVPCPGDPVNNPEIAPSGGWNTNGGRYGNTRSSGTQFHDGLDIQASPGSNLYSVMGGTVVGVRNTFSQGEYKAHSYGNYVIIESVLDNDVVRLKYNHLRTVNVAVNDIIIKGDLIALTGETGNAQTNGGVTVMSHVHIYVSCPHTSKEKS